MTFEGALVTSYARCSLNVSVLSTILALIFPCASNSAKVTRRSLFAGLSAISRSGTPSISTVPSVFRYKLEPTSTSIVAPLVSRRHSPLKAIVMIS